MARAAPLTLRRGWALVTVGPAAVVSDFVSDVVVICRLLWGRSMVGTSGGGRRLDSRRARRAATNSARGSTPTIGWRSAASGSAGIVTPLTRFGVGAAKGDARPH